MMFIVGLKRTGNRWHCQHGTQAFEAHQQQAATIDKEAKNVPIKNGKSR